MAKDSKPWRPFTARCCSSEDKTVFGNFSRCRPSRSELSKNVASLPSFRHLSFSDLSRSSSTRINEDLGLPFGSDLHVFQLSELSSITQNFSSNYLLGTGGFGTVHKGYIDENLRQGLKAQAVAVKLLDIEGHLTTKSDVYSFGVVLLELLTGRRSIDKTRPKSEQNLVDWTRPYLTSSRKLRCIMDPKLAGQYSVKGARAVAYLALQCVSPNPKNRPRMNVIVETLEGLQHLRDMAVTCGQWPATPKSGRNGVSVKGRREGRAVTYRKPSPVGTNRQI
ncbi:hypothetical protein HHK36_000569 [Tetracentron sinense]|uniref:Serine-threonine/tyrosine-protein kinase catalytic domain-containing protein n=1 Tax=Tetracentron sinense TaxID=13715 RepID=A0A834ZW35_TETSI|nr:hypothetical protein HHK36_000569 [Tetracentron sinense]